MDHQARATATERSVGLHKPGAHRLTQQYAGLAWGFVCWMLHIRPFCRFSDRTSPASSDAVRSRRECVVIIGRLNLGQNASNIVMIAVYTFVGLHPIARTTQSFQIEERREHSSLMLEWREEDNCWEKLCLSQPNALNQRHGGSDRPGSTLTMIRIRLRDFDSETKR